MDERDAPMEIGLGVAVASLVGEQVVVVHIDSADPPGLFRVRRGATYEEAHSAPVEALRPPPQADIYEWADLADTGLQVKVMSPAVPVRVGVRRLEDVSD